MIKLNTQGENTSPQLRTVLETGEQVSFLDRMSALAQKAISRLTGSGYAGGSFSRITKMIPTVMLAVFAFSAANAQIYSTGFENGSHPSITLPTGVTAAWTGGSITTSGGACTGSRAFSDGDEDGTYTYTLTLTLQAGYTMNLTGISGSFLRFDNGSSDQASAGIRLNTANYVAASNFNTGSCASRSASTAHTFTGPSTVVIDFRGTHNNSMVRVDDVVVSGTVTPACTPPSTQALTNNGPLCAGSSDLATVTLAGTQSGVTYQLINSSSAVVSTLVSTTTGAKNFPNQVAAGTYTVNAFNTGTVSCSTAVGSTTVASNLTPIAYFDSISPSVKNNGPICLGAKAIWYVKGTPGATVGYTIATNPLQTVVLDAINGTGVIEYTNTGTAGNITVNLVSATLGSCANNLNPQPNSTVTVRAALAISALNASQSICPGGTFVNIGYDITGSGSRIVYYRKSISGGATTSHSVTYTGSAATVGTTNAAALSVSGIPTTNTGTTDIVHTIIVDSVAYTSGTGNCVSTTGAGSVTLTVKPKPTFAFNFNGNALTQNPTINRICVPISSATFSITTTTGGTYKIVKDNIELGSGNVSSGTSSLLPGVNFDPGGNYEVTLTAPNGCPSTQNYTIQEVNKATFVYTINGKSITDGSNITVCAGDTIIFSLLSTSGANYTAGGTITSKSGTLGANATTWGTSKAAGTYTGTLNVTSSPVLSGCDQSISYTVTVVANPVIVGNVKLNTNTTVVNATNYQVCENENISIAISGNAGDFVEIWKNEGGSANFTTIGSQVGTFVIPNSGTYIYSYNAGPWNTNHESSSNFRDWLRIEVKHPTTLCKSSIDFNIKITQKPRLGLSYTTGNPTSPVAAAVAIANNDTVRVCYPTNFRAFFNRNSSNISGDINFLFTKDGVHASNGTIVTAQALGADYYEFPVVAGAAGWYTLSATGANGCDSSVRFYLKPNAKPSYTFVQTGTSTTPGTISFCEGYPKGVTLTGSATLTQKYTITRTAGPGSPVNFTGNLTAGSVSHVFAGLAPGTHNYTLTVTANTGADECVTTQMFNVIVTEMPKPILKANGITQVNGATYEYCEGEVVEYTIAGLPVGSAYTLTRTNNLGSFVIGTGGTVANQASVVTVVSGTTNAGTYTLKVTNSSTDVCDSIMSFTVVNNDRPDLTYIDHSNMLLCYGATNGWVRYAYSGTANMFHTFIVDLDANDTVQTHNSNLQTQSNVLHSNLAAGHYRLILSTDKGCDTSFTFTINQPASPVTVTITGTQAACNGTNGSVTFGVSGGTVPNYSVVITNSATNVIATQFTQPAAFSGYNVSNLPAATYTVTVTDANGCIGTASFTVTSCDATDLVPVVNLNDFNYSKAGTGLPIEITIVNVGQAPSTGEHKVNLLLPAGFTISSTGLSAGWTVSTSGIFTVLTNSSISIGAGFGNAVVVTGNILLTGTSSNGVKSVLINIPAGNGGDTNNANNSTATVINVID